MNFDNSVGLGSALNIIDNFSPVITGHIRGMSMNVNGQIIMGGTAEVSLPVYDKDYNLVNTQNSTGAPDPEINSHAICALPNGNYIVAEESTATGNIVNEYDKDDNFIRQVYVTVQGNHGSITECYAEDDETLYWVETGTWSFGDSNLMKLKLVAGTWTTDQLLNSETFDPGNNTNFWNFVIHSDGNIYFIPGKRNGARFNKLLKCSLNDISLAGCSAVGGAIPGEGTGGYKTWGRGGVQIPGSNDMLVFISQEIFHYDYDTGVYTSVMDLTVTIPTIDVIRNVVLAPK